MAEEVLSQQLIDLVGIHMDLGVEAAEEKLYGKAQYHTQIAIALAVSHIDKRLWQMHAELEEIKGNL